MIINGQVMVIYALRSSMHSITNGPQEAASFNNLVLLIFDVHCEGTKSIGGGRIRCTTGQVRVIVGDLVALDV